MLGEAFFASCILSEKFPLFLSGEERRLDWEKKKDIGWVHGKTMVLPFDLICLLAAMVDSYPNLYYSSGRFQWRQAELYMTNGKRLILTKMGRLWDTHNWSLGNWINYFLGKSITLYSNFICRNNSKCGAIFWGLILFCKQGTNMGWLWDLYGQAFLPKAKQQSLFGF